MPLLKSFLKRKNNVLFLIVSNILKKPTRLTFLRSFNVEEDGENKGKFDIENCALIPLIDGARLFVTSNNI
jgi:CBS domain-containing protein